MEASLPAVSTPSGRLCPTASEEVTRYTYDPSLKLSRTKSKPLSLEGSNKNDPSTKRTTRNSFISRHLLAIILIAIVAVTALFMQTSSLRSLEGVNSSHMFVLESVALSNETAGNRMEPSLASPHTAGVISPRKTSGLRRHIEGGSNATSPECQIFAASILDNWLSSRRMVCGAKEEGMVRVEEFVLDAWKGYEKIVRRYRNVESYGMTGEIEVGRKGKNGTADDCLSSNTKIETGHTSPLSSSSVALSANEGGGGREELFEVIDYPIIRIRPFDFYNSYERFHAYLNVAMVMMMFENDNITTNPQLVFMTPDFRSIPEGDKDMWRTFSDREPVFGSPSEEQQQQQQKSETSSGKNNDTTTTTKRKRYRYKDLIEAPSSGTSMLVVPSRGRDHHCKSELFRGILRWMKQNLGVLEEEKSNETMKVRVLWSSRQPYCCRPRPWDPHRKILNETGLVDVVQSILGNGYRIDMVDFAKRTTLESVQLAANSDVLVGVHGAGLVWTGFMMDNNYGGGGRAGLVELFGGDRSRVNRHYHNLASLAGIGYRELNMQGSGVDTSLHWTIKTASEIADLIRDVLRES